MTVREPSKFLWSELVTADAEASLDFYRHVMGWSVEPLPMGNDRTYHQLLASGRGLGGVFQTTREERDAGMKSGWVGYIHSPDVDDDARRIQQAGGRVHRQPEDISVGRLAPVSDPQGAGFMLFKPKPPPGKTPELASGVGSMTWAELHTTDGEAAFRFYSEMFGWSRGEAMPMGALGNYQVFHAGQEPIGGMMKNPQSGPPYWLFYFRVKTLNEAVTRIKEKKGELVQNPQQVPGGDWTIQARDPQGGLFAIVASQR